MAQTQMQHAFNEIRKGCVALNNERKPSIIEDADAYISRTLGCNPRVALIILRKLRADGKIQLLEEGGQVIACLVGENMPTLKASVQISTPRMKQGTLPPAKAVPLELKLDAQPPDVNQPSRELEAQINQLEGTITRLHRDLQKAENKRAKAERDAQAAKLSQAKAEDATRALRRELTALREQVAETEALRQELAALRASQLLPDALATSIKNALESED